MTEHRKKKENSRKRMGNFLVNGATPYFIMVLPLFIIYIVLTIIPTVSTAFLSFTNFNGVDLWHLKMVGFRNYLTAFKDTVFGLSLKNTILYAIVVPLVQNFLGMIFALALNKNLKTKNILRTLLFTPAIISTIVISYAWTYIFDYNGIINQILGAIGLERLQQVWLGNPKYALMCVAVSNIWRFIGYSAVIFIANLQSISTDILEAADIDGAAKGKRFRYIIFPLMAPSTTINLTLSVIGCLKVFDTVFTMTQGGPGHATEVVGTYIVSLQTQHLNGYASCLAIILTFIILVLTAILFPILKRREEN